jgi:hypothetical protein
MPSNKDRLLQIELAKLQLEAQLCTTATFGLVALGVSTLILFETLYFTLSSEYAQVKSVLPYSMVVLSITVFIVTGVLLHRIQKVEDRIEGLKGQFCN